METQNNIFFISLGCAKNLVDSEHMLGLLISEGYDLAMDVDEAGIAVINTCGFIQASVEEAIATILEMADLRKKGELKKLIVAGCFVQRYGYKLRKEIPEVDGWLGTGDVHRIAEVIGDDAGLLFLFISADLSTWQTIAFQGFRQRPFTVRSYGLPKDVHIGVPTALSPA